MVVVYGASILLVQWGAEVGAKVGGEGPTGGAGWVLR